MPKTETLAQRVAQLRREKQARERRDIPQAEVADAIGVSRPVISETESGKTYPSKGTIRKLARYYGVSEVFLEYGVEQPSRAPTAAEALANAETMTTVSEGPTRRKKSS